MTASCSGDQILCISRTRSVALMQGHIQDFTAERGLQRTDGSEFPFTKADDH